MEDNGKLRISVVDVPVADRDRWQSAAKADDRSLSSWIRKACNRAAAEEMKGKENGANR